MDYGTNGHKFFVINSSLKATIKRNGFEFNNYPFSLNKKHSLAHVMPKCHNFSAEKQLSCANKNMLSRSKLV